ncbi:MAG: tRNA (adenosine(37)-N6)-threonylcarbamoyltransferase complex dimerization subunit type 1 TsaB [Croceitalea sp.]|nr:tRNA (adenosine(37)-N6)-threonylcarbamoyltransferase complex dimerization subunit type 1 TsaB [Croceitalea sp.]
MALILNIETATTNCSVSIGSEDKVIALVEENSAGYSHAEQLHVFIAEALKMASVSFNELNAIAVSMGPGSYTGLRIGVSAAKGLCFALDVPLIATATLESMAHQLKVESGEILIPLLDARRMEVYAAVFDHNYKQMEPTKAKIIETTSFSEYSDYKTIHLLGNGAEKCEPVLIDKKFKYHNQVIPSAKEMVQLSYTKLKASRFEDLAYFEPFYLKDFVLQTKKKS